jgi:hypothetical protein
MKTATNDDKISDKHYAAIITRLRSADGFGVEASSGKFAGAWFSFSDSSGVDLRAADWAGVRREIEVRDKDDSGLGLTEPRLNELGGDTLDPLVFALAFGSGRISLFAGGALDDIESASLVDSGRRRPGGLAGAAAG